MNTILLDAGGVILDETAYERIGAQVITAVLRDFDPEYSIESYWQDSEESTRILCPRTRDYIFYKRAKRELGTFNAIKSRYLEAWNEAKPRLELMRGIYAEIDKLSSRFRLVLCGQYGREILELLDEAGLSRFFASRLTQDDYGLTKPDPRYFEEICRREGLAPAACVMVGDRIEKDIIPAKLLGMGTVFVRTGIYRNQRERTPDEEPDMVLEGIAGLADAILGRWS